MNDFEKNLHPNRDGFNKDPFGYSLLARQKWGLVRSMAGFPIDISKPATSEELKNPILWLAHAHALSEAALAVIGKEQDFNDMPIPVRSICDSQYCAVGLMLELLSNLVSERLITRRPSSWLSLQDRL